jgi:hypothetical protein
MKTNRGFTYFEFKDRNGEECSIQKSSIATEDCIWLGCDNNSTPHHVTGECGSPRMHVDKKLARKLIKYLTKFVETGDL